MRMWNLIGLIALLPGCYDTQEYGANAPTTDIDEARSRVQADTRHLEGMSVSRSETVTTNGDCGPAPAVGVCGNWESVTSHKTYLFLCRDTVSFDIFEGNPADGKLIGNGKQVGSIVAGMGTFDVAGTPRQAVLRFRLEDANTLTGSFIGEDPKEAGALKFVRRTVR